MSKKEYINFSRQKEKKDSYFSKSANHPNISLHSSNSNLCTNSYDNDMFINKTKTCTRQPYDYIDLNTLFMDKKYQTTQTENISVHIPPAETLNASIDFDWIPNEQLHNPKKKLQKQRLVWQRITTCKQELENPFEMPRQQENIMTEPEVMQYKSHQQLLNPNDSILEKDKDLQHVLDANEITNDKMFKMVFKGYKMNDLQILPLPDQIIAPRKKGVHVKIYSIKDVIKIKSAHNDDLGRWSGKPHTYNYIIKDMDEKIEATEIRPKNVVTHAQCYVAKHAMLLEQGILIKKKIYSATTPSSQTPSQNTLIVIVYDVEKDFDSLDISTVTQSPSTPLRKSSFLQKRPSDTKPESSKEKVKKSHDLNFISNNENVKSSLDPTKNPLIELRNKFFEMLPSTSPVSSLAKEQPSADSSKLIRKLSLELKTVKDELQKMTLKNEEMKEKFDLYYDKWYKLCQRFDNLKKKTAEQKDMFEAENTCLKSQLEKASNDFFEMLEKTKDANTVTVIKEMEEEILTLQDILKDLKDAQSKVYAIKVNEKYTPDAKLAMARLTDMGVAVHTVGPAMACVAEMLGYTLNAIPSARTVGKSPFLTISLNQEQLRQAILDAKERNIATTSCSDETKKAGLIWLNHMFCTLDEQNKARTYCMGNAPGITKSSDSSIEALEKMVESLNTDDGSNYWEIFIMSLGNRMSDEAGTEKLLTKKVEDVRKVIIDSEARFADLNENQKEALSKLRSFYCQLHVLQNLTPIATNILLEDEKERRGNQDIPKLAVLSLLEGCSRHLGSRTASKYTSNVPWVDYCKNSNIKFGKIPDFIGNRFNILFAIAACVFYLRHHIIDFIEKFDTDMRKTPILQWLKDPIVVSHLHLLAAFNAYVTAPLLRLTEHSTSMSTLTEHAESLFEFLEDVKANPLTLFIGHAPFDDYEEAEEVTERSIAHVIHLDNATVSHSQIMTEVVEELAEATIQYFKKKYKDFLPGGQHYMTTADIRTVPRHNKGCEHNFGLLTWDYRNAPNKRPAVRAIKIQTIINKTHKWFNQLSTAEKEKLLNDALSNMSVQEKNASQQQKAFEEARLQQLLQKQREDEIANGIRARKQAEANNAVRKYGGCWRTVEEASDFLEHEHNDKEKRKAVEAQLKCHRLSPTTTKNHLKLCVLSMKNAQNKRVSKPLDILIRNLTAIIVFKLVIAEEETDDEQ